MQGKLHHHLQVKEPYVNSNWLHVGLHPATWGVHCLCPPRRFRHKERNHIVKLEILF